MEDEIEPGISFEAFAARARVLTGREAADLRARYIDRFVDTNTPYYRDFIAHIVSHSDGPAYSGYLWDTLAGARALAEQDVYDERLLDETPCAALA